MKTAPFVLFDIGAETFAIAASQVVEVIEFQALARVPSLPRCVRGMTNLRGTVLPVIDLAIKFGRDETRITRRTCVVVVEAVHDGATTLLGVMTELVRDVQLVSSDDVEPAPAFGTAVDAAYLAGVVRLPNRFALVIDVDLVLSIDELLDTHVELARSVPA